MALKNDMVIIPWSLLLSSHNMIAIEIYEKIWFKLVRFAHNWNNGMVEMVEWWFKENKTLSTYSALISIF